jgi:glutamate/tyrosine decarboxylase-like PLP-dependent enzyme
MTLMTYGTDRIGRVAERCCAHARRLAAMIDCEPSLELAAPVALNIVCFRYRPGSDAMQAMIAADLQVAGNVVLSLTTRQGRTVLRAAFVNHRTGEDDVDAVVPAVLAAGHRNSAGRTMDAAAD